MRLCRAAIWTLLFFPCTGAVCSMHSPGPPEPDTCDDPAAPAVDAVELGSGSYDEDAPFVPWRDRDVVEETRGAQGGSMLGVRLRLAGTELPECAYQETVVHFSPSLGLLAESRLAVKLHGDDRSLRTTKTLWLIFESDVTPGQELSVETKVGSATARRIVSLGSGDTAPRRLALLSPSRVDLEVGSRRDLSVVLDRPARGDEGPVAIVTSSDAIVALSDIEARFDLGVSATFVTVVARSVGTATVSAILGADRLDALVRVR